MFPYCEVDVRGTSVAKGVLNSPCFDHCVYTSTGSYDSDRNKIVFLIERFR